MARAFRRKDDRYVARFDATERAVVAELLEQTRELLAPPEQRPARPPRGGPSAGGDTFDEIVAGLDASVGPQDMGGHGTGRAAGVDPAEVDPAVQRLLPTGHRGDEQVAAEFRRLTEHDLRSRKAATLATAVAALRAASGDRLELTRQQAEAVVVALTDTRLVLGERLGLRTDDDALTLDERVAALPSDDPAVGAVAIYDFLTWMQESLATALMSRRPR